MSLYALHPFDKESVGACCAEYAENNKEKKILCVQGRFKDKEEGEEKQSSEEILVKSDEHTGELKRQLSVQDSEHGKS